MIETCPYSLIQPPPVYPRRPLLVVPCDHATWFKPESPRNPVERALWRRFPGIAGPLRCRLQGQGNTLGTVSLFKRPLIDQTLDSPPHFLFLWGGWVNPGKRRGKMTDFLMIQLNFLLIHNWTQPPDIYLDPGPDDKTLKQLIARFRDRVRKRLYAYLGVMRRVTER